MISLTILILILAPILLIQIIWDSKESQYLIIASLLYILLVPQKYFPMIILMPAVFTLAPKFAREMGFLILGLFLIDPQVREGLTPINILTLSAFSLVLALRISPLPSGKFARALYTGILGILSGLLGIFIPPFPLLSIAYIFVFPLTSLSYTYAFVTVLTSIVLHEFGLYSFPDPALPSTSILTAIAIPLILIIYSIYIEKKGILRKRQTLTLLMFSLFMAPFIPYATQAFVLLLAATSVRLVMSLPHPEETL
ncbi:hypothetical protein [Pyrococcus kukulkanii]|uniref:Uncharacterized protein n=1 Tax=Pyrococcus kukulkanii TaxID=1609559 RepID=A0A127B8F7_9EURY|nr:hypothetical protein [Pyrococcus kukulkanii]AMM53651.1 hypothetical protein TQ32_03510 [Pyrococcus kukulkanii]